MNKSKMFNVMLGVLNIIAGAILVTFVILMQNLMALVMGMLYIVFGVGMLGDKIYKKLLFGGIMPLTVLFSFNITMIAIDKNLPKYLQIPLYIGAIIIMPLWVLIFGDIWLIRKRRRK